MIDGKPRSVSVTADGPLSTLVVPHPPFASILEAEPAVARELLLVLCAAARGRGAWGRRQLTGT